MKILSFKTALLFLFIATTVLLISEITSNPFILKLFNKNVGSFEYVRIAERLLNKGRYDKAIYYYEEAFKSSPASETIIAGLEQASVKYAFLLADSEKYDDAIRCMLRAYNVRQDSYTAQNLAIMYSKKALMFAKKEELLKAAALFTEARNLARYSYALAKNLGILLFNDASNEYKEGREEAALLCARESSLAHRDYRAFRLLGDIYYKRGELRKARFYWHRANRMNPEDAAAAAKLKRIIKELQLSESEELLDIPHFEIRYKKGLNFDSRLAAAVLEKAYLDIGKDLDYFTKAKTRVYFYSTEDFVRIFKVASGVRAFYDGNIRIPLPESRLGGAEFSRYIYHEYTHAVLSAKTMNNCPVWFSEGIALWEEYGKSGRYVDKFPIRSGDVDNLTLDSLAEEFEKGEITPKRALFYLLSYSVVKFIIDGWGVPGLRDLLKRLADKQHIANAIDDEFLLSEKEFERRWRIYLRNNFLK